MGMSNGYICAECGSETVGVHERWCRFSIERIPEPGANVSVLDSGQWTCEKVALALHEELRKRGNIEQVAVVFVDSEGYWRSIIGSDTHNMKTGEMLLASEILRRRALESLTDD